MPDESLKRPRDETELVDVIRSVDVAAPEHLHAHIEAMIADRGRGARATPAGLALGGRRVRIGAAATVLAALAAALVLALSGSGTGGLSLQQAYALTTRPATAPAPAESGSARGSLAKAVEGVSFPYWEERFGWRSTGTREDRVGGRAVSTVFYTDGAGRRIGYAIVAGAPARAIAGGVANLRRGTVYRLHRVDGAEVVTWTRNGRLCVVSGRGVDGRTLLALASWE